MIMMDSAVWRSEDDGSLRGHYPDTRCEYILTSPLKIDAVGAALKTLKDDLDAAGAELKFSYRCSVHVHVNVQQMEYQQLLAMIYGYYLLEEPFMTYCGKSRKGNNFCLRLSDAEGVLDTLTRMFETPDMLHAMGHDHNRYAAMNFEALQKYGSLEFRGMEGNLDVKRIETWCKALVRLREWAIKQDTPKAVYELYTRLGPIVFLEDVLGDLVGDFQYARCIKDIQKSFSISIDLPFSFRLHKEEAPKAKKKKPDWQIGDFMTHADAIKFVARGGRVELRKGWDQFAPMDGLRYVVTKEVEPIRVPDIQAAMRGGQWAIVDEPREF
ncbi:hypothetical protein WT58_24030 [Burkholderia territorii]|nr:hypothetical protein WT58_24030 [Burkholderia territorii]